MSRRNQRKIGELLKRDHRGEDLRLNWETDVVYLHAVDLLDRAKKRLPLDDPDYEFLVMALEDYVVPAARGRTADQEAKATKVQNLAKARAEYRRWRDDDKTLAGGGSGQGSARLSGTLCRQRRQDNQGYTDTPKADAGRIATSFSIPHLVSKLVAQHPEASGDF
jgi:hypothetical protein